MCSKGFAGGWSRRGGAFLCEGWLQLGVAEDALKLCDKIRGGRRLKVGGRAVARNGLFLYRLHSKWVKTCMDAILF